MLLKKGYSSLPTAYLTLQTVFDSCVPKNELAKYHSQLWTEYLQSGLKTPSVKSKNRLWKYTVNSLQIKYLFSRNIYVCQIWIFIFDTSQGQIYSVHYIFWAKNIYLYIIDASWRDRVIRFSALRWHQKFLCLDWVLFCCLLKQLGGKLSMN